MMTPDELGRLIDEHGPSLTLYAQQWCTAPDDVVQEAFIKLVSQRHRPDKVVAWLYRVVRNAAVSLQRSENSRRRHETQKAECNSSWFQSSDFNELDAETATAALQALPADQREAITLHLWARLTFEETAQVMGISSSSAHRLYTKGLNALRERLCHV